MLPETSQSSDHAAQPALPIHPLTLNFRSADRESAYRHARFKSLIASFRWTGYAALALHAIFMYLDYLVLAERMVAMVYVRLFVLVPVIILLLAFSFHRYFESYGQLATAVAVLIHCLAMTLGIVLFGPDTTVYFIGGMVMILMFGYLLLGLRFAVAAPICILSVAATLAVVFQQQLPTEQTVIATEVLVLSIGILSLGGHRMEIGSRETHYIAEQLLAQERREREWLSLVAGFVRHELKNSVAGIGSSLQLIGGAALDVRTTEYVGRATRSLQFMRRFLDQVAAATNLEGALKQQDTDVVSLSELVSACVDDVRLLGTDRTLRCNVDENLLVRGNADSLAQMVDKLLNNALEHSITASTIDVHLAAVNGKVVLQVSNHGDRLPADPERLFKPFVSSKQSTNGNLGLGLYVAQTIATHHSGAIIVTPLTDPDGARFVVTLPLASEAPQARA